MILWERVFPATFLYFSGFRVSHGPRTPRCAGALGAEAPPARDFFYLTRKAEGPEPGR